MKMIVYYCLLMFEIEIFGAGGGWWVGLMMRSYLIC